MKSEYRYQLNNFIQSYLSTRWMCFEHIGIYVRKNMHHIINGELIPTFDILRVFVDIDKQNQGIFTEFLECVEELGYSVYIENIMTARFQQSFVKRGYELFDVDKSSGYKNALKRIP